MGVLLEPERTLQLAEAFDGAVGDVAVEDLFDDDRREIREAQTTGEVTLVDAEAVREFRLVAVGSGHNHLFPFERPRQNLHERRGFLLRQFLDRRIDEELTRSAGLELAIDMDTDVACGGFSYRYHCVSP